MQLVREQAMQNTFLTCLLAVLIGLSCVSEAGARIKDNGSMAELPPGYKGAPDGKYAPLPATIEGNPPVTVTLPSEISKLSHELARSHPRGPDDYSIDSKPKDKTSAGSKIIGEDEDSKHEEAIREVVVGALEKLEKKGVISLRPWAGGISPMDFPMWIPVTNPPVPIDRINPWYKHALVACMFCRPRLGETCKEAFFCVLAEKPVMTKKADEPWMKALRDITKKPVGNNK